MTELQVKKQNLRQQFEHFLLTDYPSDAGETLKEAQKYAKEMYFSDPDGSIPDQYIGEDILNDINSKFYRVLSFIRSLFEAKHPEAKDVFINVDPSYEDHTCYVVHQYSSHKVLLSGNDKAWNFWWRNVYEFKRFVTSTLEAMEEIYKPQTLHVVINNYGGVLNDIDPFVDEADALKQFEVYAEIPYATYAKRKAAYDKGKRGNLWDDEDTDVQVWEIKVIPKGGKPE